MVFKDGNVYEGEWWCDQMNGRGKMVFKDGNVYEGEWWCDRMDGWKDDVRLRRLRGQMVPRQREKWQDGVRRFEGNGTAERNSTKARRCTRTATSTRRREMSRSRQDEVQGRRRLRGCLEEQLSHGQGKMRCRHVFEWERVAAAGKMTYANCDVYDGKWLGLERHGQGKMTYANGDVFGGLEQGKRGEGVLKTHKDQILALVDEHIRDLDVLWKPARQLWPRHQRRVCTSSSSTRSGPGRGRDAGHSSRGSQWRPIMSWQRGHDHFALASRGAARNDSVLVVDGFIPHTCTPCSRACKAAPRRAAGTSTSRGSVGCEGFEACLRDYCLEKSFSNIRWLSGIPGARSGGGEAEQRSSSAPSALREPSGPSPRLGTLHMPSNRGSFFM